MSTTKLHEFKVVLEGIELSATAKERIQNGLQSALLQEIARFAPQSGDPDDDNFPGNLNGSIIFLPHHWIGIWLRVLAPYEIGGIEKVLDIKGGGFAENFGV